LSNKNVHAKPHKVFANILVFLTKVVVPHHNNQVNLYPCMTFILTMNPKISIQHPMSINYSQKSKSLFKKEPIPFIYTAAIPNGIQKINNSRHHAGWLR